MKRRHFYVYMLANGARMLYIGVTNDLERRLSEHKQKLIPGYASKYNLNRLVYFEEYPYVPDAIAREKQLKHWLRSRKVALVEAENPAGWISARIGTPTNLLCHLERSERYFRARLSAFRIEIPFAPLRVTPAEVIGATLEA